MPANRQVVVSTVGTSVLTNVAHAQQDLAAARALREGANVGPDAATPELQVLVTRLAADARAGLAAGGPAGAAKASAELNGILAVYGGTWPAAGADHHVLIASDTYVGRQAAAVIQATLADQGLGCEVYAPAGLTTATSAEFAAGMDELVTWMERTLPGYRADGWRVVFNLVGAFKVLQGYMNTLGMFHADELLYIFDDAQAEPIRIPRLPIRVDERVLAPHAVPLALMAAGCDRPAAAITGIPEALLFVDGGRALLNQWGGLVWERAADDLLGGDLLAWPRLEYAETFRRDFRGIREAAERARVQRKLARASALLEKSNGDLAALRQDGGLLYETYRNQGDVGHFRLDIGDRVSCEPVPGGLRLRRVGRHDEVNDRP